MGRKFFYIFTLLFYLFHCSTIHADDTKTGEFPLKGGTTSDGIVISNVTMEGMRKMAKTNTLHIESDADKASYNFNVTVPDGKTACLKYRLLLRITMEPGVVSSSSISFMSRLDGKQVNSHRNPVCLAFQSDEIIIPAGEHEVSFEAQFQSEESSNSGQINITSIHVHDFGPVKLSSEAICGLPGQSNATCTICGKDSVLTILPKYSKHSLITQTEKKVSCLYNAVQTSKCEHCPYTLITYSGDVYEHKFDQNGKCRVCHLSMPRQAADTTVYEIHNAGEWRVLAEMVSIGRISGNIGVDIKSDLVFNSDTTLLPLGTFDHPFQGVLNGNGHHIRGIVNAFQGIDCLGLVGVAKGTVTSHAVIANLIFDSGNSLQGQACVGGIVGHASHCNIVNCASFATLEGTDNVGGIVGYADLGVSIKNCASVCAFRVQGKWNIMACGMPHGHILNSYGTGSNILEGTYDQIKTTDLRHCFSTLPSEAELTQVSQDAMTSITMIQLLNEESETDCFTLPEGSKYPIPVVNTTISAKSNDALPKQRSNWRRAMLAEQDDAGGDDPKQETVELNGYADETASRKLGQNIDEVLYNNSVQYSNFKCLYIATFTVPEGFEVYDRIDGGSAKALESYMMPADSSYLSITEYSLISPNKLRAVTETVLYDADGSERIDQYTINSSGIRTLNSQFIFKGNYDLTYKKNVDGILKTVANIETKYDDEGNPTVSNGYSYDQTTGETNLEFTENHSDNEGNKDGTYEEYVDSLTNTVHIIFNNLDPASKEVVSREHYILRASDLFPLEYRLERMIDGKPWLEDGMYFLYDEEGLLEQTVAYGPVDKNLLTSQLRPYLYHEYIGSWPGELFPTAIQIPTTAKPSMQKRMDMKVYDMHGRIVRSVTNAKDPFSGLPHGLYIYHGAKYLKK